MRSGEFVINATTMSIIFSGVIGYLWSSSADTTRVTYAFGAGLNNIIVNTSDNSGGRHNGFSLRCLAS